MVVTVIPHPRDRISRQRHGRAGCEHKFEPFRHLESAMGEVTMQIKSCANTAPEKQWDHDGQIKRMEARQQSDESEQLQGDQDNEKEEIESFVLKHLAQGQEAANPGHSTPTSNTPTEWTDWQAVLSLRIGVTGFEPATSWSQTTRSTKLSYTPPLCGMLITHRCSAHPENWRGLAIKRTDLP